MNDAPQSLKWTLFAVLFGIAAWFVLPFVLTLASMILQLVVIVCVLGALWLLLPALAEWLAQISYVLWAGAIGMNPTSRLRRDLRSHAEQIVDIENGISKGDAEVRELRALLKQQSPHLTADEREEWAAQILELENAGAEMVLLRDEELAKHAKFERQIQRLEANWKIGRAFKGALKSFSFRKKTGMESDGSQVALQKIQSELATSQSRLRTVLSRKAVERTLSLPSSAGGEPAPVIKLSEKVTR